MKRFTIFLSTMLFAGTVLLAQNWTSISSGISTDLSAGAYLDELNLFATGFDGVIYSSADGGLTWGSSYEGTIPLNSIACNNDGILVAVGFAGTILRYDGSTWQTITSVTSNALNAICFADVLTGYAVGENGTVLKTTDAGLTWGLMLTRSNDWLTGVNAFDANNVAAVSENGTLFQSNNGASSWTQTTVPGFPWLGAVAMTGPNTGWLSGSGGILFAFLGTVLTPYPTGTLDGLVAMMLMKVFINTWIGYAVGDFGHIFRYANGPWVDQGSQTSKHLLGLMLMVLLMNDDGIAADSVELRACAVGMNGVVLLNSEVITGLNDPPPGEPSSFIYPNPTTGEVCFLNGTLPAEGIELTLTDLSGKEVLTQTILYPMTPIDLRKLKTGLYIAHIKKEARVYIEKVLVIRD